MNITSTRKTKERKIVTRFQVEPFVVRDVYSNRNAEIVAIDVAETWDEEGYWREFHTYGYHIKADGARRADANKTQVIATGAERQMISDWIEENV